MRGRGRSDERTRARNGMRGSRRCILVTLVFIMAPYTLEAQSDPVPCSEFMGLAESRRSTLTAGMMLGYAAAFGLAGRMARHVDSDTTGMAAVRSLELGMNPEADRDSLRGALESWNRGRGQGAKMVVEFVKGKLEAASAISSRGLAHQIAARCSRPENQSRSVGFMLVEVLNELDRAQ